jgi:apolipoprotein N-acyltransferase
MLYLFVPALFSALLLWLAFFPANLGPLGFVALIPWLTLVVTAGRRWHRYAAAYGAALVFSALATQWVRVAHPMMYLAWLGFTLILPLFWLAALAGLRGLYARGLPLTLALPVVLVTLDYVRMHFPTGFPFLAPLGLQQRIGFGWYFLGYTQHEFLPFIQSADLGGIYVVTALVAAVNGLLADWLFRSGAFRRHWPLEPSVLTPVSPSCHLAVSGLVILLLLANLLYGFYRLAHAPWEEGPQVAALQGVIPQDQKNARADTLIRTYRMLHDQAVRQSPRPDLIIWPETCCPVDYCEVAPGEIANPDFAYYAQKCRDILQRFDPGVPTLLGLNALVWEQGRQWKYNSALLLQPGPQRFGPRYDKIHLVPFGEYVPFGQTLPFLRHFTPYPYDYSCRAGEQWTRFRFTDRQGRNWSFACLICYEDTDPDLARQYVADDPVDFLVNISNDGWFEGTEEHEQHLAICRFRAIECRRSVVRAVNMGISAVIDPDGQVIALPHPHWSRSKQVEAVVQAAVPIDRRQALYPHLGDGLVALTALSWFAVTLLLRPRQQP